MCHPWSLLLPSRCWDLIRVWPRVFLDRPQRRRNTFCFLRPGQVPKCHKAFVTARVTGKVTAPPLGAHSSYAAKLGGVGGRGCQRHAADCVCPRGDMLIVYQSRNTARESLLGAAIWLLLHPKQLHPSCPSPRRQRALVPSCCGRRQSSGFVRGSLEGKLSSGARRHPRLPGGRQGARRAGGRAPPGSVLLFPHILSGSRRAGGEPGRLRRREQRGRQLPCMGKAGTGGRAAARSAGLTRDTPEHPRAASPAPPPGRWLPGPGAFRPSSGGRPGALLPGGGALVGGLSRPFSRSPTNEQRNPYPGAASTAVLPLRFPPRRDRRHPSVSPPAPAPLVGIPGTWQGAEQAAGGGEVEQGAPRPLHAGPIRAGSAGGTGAVPGRAGGRGGAGGTWSSPGPGGVGRGDQLPAPTLPARYPTSPCRIAHSRSSPHSVPGTLGSVHTAAGMADWPPALWVRAGHPWYSPTPALASSERALLLRTGHPRYRFSLFWESLAQVCITSSPPGSSDPRPGSHHLLICSWHPQLNLTLPFMPHAGMGTADEPSVGHHLGAFGQFQDTWVCQHS